MKIPPHDTPALPASRAAKIVYAVAALVLAVPLALWLHPPALLYPFAAWSAARSVCGPGQLLSGISETFEMRQNAAWLRPQLKMEQATPTGPIQWRVPNGAKVWLPAGSERALPTLLAQQEFDIYRVGGVGVRSGDVVLDCGAHVGLFTRKALLAGARLVVAIEPSQRNLECLRRNLAAEIDEKKVIVYPKGVWDKDDVLTFFDDPANSAAASLVVSHADSKQTLVPVTTIDRIVEELGIGKVDFVKMDIKGAARRALAGAAQTLRRDHPRVVVSTEEGDEPREVVSALRSAAGNYGLRCGLCSRQGLSVEPDVIAFQ